MRTYIFFFFTLSSERDIEPELGVGGEIQKFRKPKALFTLRKLYLVKVYKQDMTMKG